MELKEFTEYLVKSIAKEPDMVKVQQLVVKMNLQY